MKIIEENMYNYFYNLGLKEASLNLKKARHDKNKRSYLHSKNYATTIEKFYKAKIMARLKYK